MKYYYAVCGPTIYSPTQYVYVFNSRKARDGFLNRCSVDPSCRSITREEAIDYGIKVEKIEKLVINKGDERMTTFQVRSDEGTE